MNKRGLAALLFIVIALCIWRIVAVHTSPLPDGLNADERAATDRLYTIAKRTDGDWNKLTADERSFLLKDVAHGSEATAKMLLLAKSGKLTRKTPGAPIRR
jgi:hypothetical protein